MKDSLEKSLKRYLKRKVKITLGFIIAFLLGSSLSLADSLYIRDGENGIEFSLDNNTWGENPYSENSFENNVYINNIVLESARVGIVNSSSNISLTNNNIISVKGQDGAWGIDNSGEIIKLENNGLLEVNGVNNTTGIGNYEGTIGELLNLGIISVVSSSENAWGIDNSGTITTKLDNSGLIEVNGTGDATGIGNYEGTIGELLNQGIISIVSSYGYAWGASISNKIPTLINNGNIRVVGKINSTGIGIYGDIDNLTNNGIIFSKVENDESAYGLYIEQNFSNNVVVLNNGMVEATALPSADNGYYLSAIQYSRDNSGDDSGSLLLINNGIYKSMAEGINTKTINYASSIENSKIENNGIIFSNSGKEAYGIQLSDANLNILENNGVIFSKGDDEDTGAVYISRSSLNTLENTGVIFSNKDLITKGADTTSPIAKIENKGLLIGNTQNINDISETINNNGIIFNISGSGYAIKEKANTEIKVGEKTVINANLIDEQNKNTDDWTATGSENIVLNGENKSDMIYNGITDTLKISGENSLTNSTVNGYTSAIVFDEKGGSLILDNSIINGGLDEKSATIKGSNVTDNLALTNGTIINGDTDLGAGDDKLSIDNTVQINGDLNGGVGIDNLTFNNSVIKSNENNINIFNKINGFENINIETDVTFFESSKVTGTENINIDENGNMIVRVGTEETGGKLNNHVLNNVGTAVSGNGTLLLILMETV